MIFQKWHGAGNDFLIADNRDSSLNLDAATISRLCDRHTGIGADGVILLSKSDVAPFRMVFYNPDGSTGMFCGNGGRCIAAYAHTLGYETLDFEAADGVHQALMCSRDGNEFTINLSMADVEGFFELPEGDYYLNTGTRHLVHFVPDVKKVNVAVQGRKLRNDRRFAPEGVNVDFVEEEFGVLYIRTFEKGVEAETLACGTGVVASSIAAYLAGIQPTVGDDVFHSYRVDTAISSLTVQFCHRRGTRPYFDNVRLIGPAEYIATIEI